MTKKNKIPLWKRLFSVSERVTYGLPKYKKDVWWNADLHAGKKKDSPKVFDANGKYIDCRVGQIVPADETDDGHIAYYKVTKVWQRPGGDWLYASDANHCNLKFSHLEKK